MRIIDIITSRLLLIFPEIFRKFPENIQPYYLAASNGHSFPKVLQYQSAHCAICHTALGAPSFSAASPKMWKFLPPALHSCNCPDTFQQHLKAHLFPANLFILLGTSLLAPQIQHLLMLCVFRYFINLVTYLQWLPIIRSKPRSVKAVSARSWILLNNSPPSILQYIQCNNNDKFIYF